MIVPGPASQAAEASAPSNQSARSIADGEAPMGVATTRSMERVAAAVGALEGAETRFERADDVAHGGVLCALAALLAFGLLRHAQSHFSAPKGFYPMESIFLLLAYLALGRVPSLEQLRYHSPGEWGKLLGLDRIPEVKTLRAKISVLGDDEERTARWSGDLAKDWMAHDVKAAGVLLIDGHVRVYHGEATKLPRRYPDFPSSRPERPINTSGAIFFGLRLCWFGVFCPGGRGSEEV